MAVPSEGLAARGPWESNPACQQVHEAGNLTSAGAFYRSAAVDHLDAQFNGKAVRLRQETVRGNADDLAPDDPLAWGEVTGRVAEWVFCGGCCPSVLITTGLGTHRP